VDGEVFIPDLDTTDLSSESMKDVSPRTWSAP